MHFFRVSFKNSLSYRWSVFFAIIGSVLYIAINLMIWNALYRGDVEKISYMTRYTIIANIIGMLFPRDIHNKIGDKVASGDFVIDLVRPINLFLMSWEIELASIISNLLLKGLPVIAIYLPFLIVSDGYLNIPFVVLAIVLGHILFLMIYALLGFTAFVLVEIWPFGRLLDDTIRLFAGGFIPLAMLPSFLGVIARILPFRFLYSFPLELLLGKTDMNLLFEDFVVLILWVIFFSFLNYIMYKTALKKAVVQGG